jgi:hypothetical protein
MIWSVRLLFLPVEFRICSALGWLTSEEVMSTASNKAIDQGLPSAPDGTMGGSQDPATAATLKLVKTVPSVNGEHILVHFVSTQDQIVTIQLEIAFATRFYQNLGSLLDQLKAMEAPQPRWH